MTIFPHKTVPAKILKVYWPPGGLQNQLRTQRLQRTREREVAEFARSVRGLSSARLQGNFLTRMTFGEGIGTYVLGFYIASIFHSSLAVEIALLIGVADKRAKSEPNRGAIPRKLRDFGKLIDEARELSFIDEPTAQLADNVRLLRNSYVHFYNALYLARRGVLNPELVSQAVEVLSADSDLIDDEHFKAAFANVDLEKAKEKAGAIRFVASSVPVLDISSFIDRDAAEFFDSRTRAHGLWELKNLILNEGFDLDDIQELMLARGRFMGIDKYDRKRFDALDTLSWSHDLLKRLGTFGEDLDSR